MATVREVTLTPTDDGYCYGEERPAFFPKYTRHTVEYESPLTGLALQSLGTADGKRFRVTYFYEVER